MQFKPLELSGKRFDRLLVIKQIGRDKHRKVIWECICDCGTIKNIVTGELTGGQKSCGCLATEKRLTNRKTHGLSHTREYKIWQDMKARCDNPKKMHYDLYGGRGIKVCDRWVNSFENFFEDMGYATTSEHTLDRRNGKLGYSKENCRWATRKEQGENTNRVIWIEYNGARKNKSEWASFFNITSDTFNFHYKRKNRTMGEIFDFYKLKNGVDYLSLLN